MAARNYGQYCGLVTALELVGERWALLIVRDLLVGPRRYTDLKQGLPRIPTNILSTRLKELQESGVIHRVPLARCGLVYELTEFGRDLEDVVLALGRWGFQAMGNPAPDDVITNDSMTMAFRTAFQADAARDRPATVYVAHVGDVTLTLRVADGTLTVLPSEEPNPDLTFAAGPGIRAVISGELTPTDSIEQGVVDVLAGDSNLLERFAATFHLESAAIPVVSTAT